VWKQFILDMPQGEPAPGDRGLDNTPTWGRTYWGGAMFCLIADVQIRERTQNRKGLQDSLRAILGHGGVITEDWDIERAFAIGDQATGTDVLQSLYKEMRDKPAPIDLDNLWQKLGVALKNGKVIFNNNAADAPIRKAIVSHH
jgi:predicted metalloprotease with PDZ domain